MNCDRNSIGNCAVFFTANCIKLGISSLPKLAIISRDYLHYQNALAQLKLNGEFTSVELVWANKDAEGAPLEQFEYVLANPNIMSRYIEKCHNLLWLQSTWAGITPLIGKLKRDYQLSGLKDVFGGQMREYVMAYLLYFQRKVPELIANQERNEWQQYKIPTLQNQTMGIMGLGSIGRDVAHAAKAFGMKVQSLNASSKPDVADKHFHLDQISAFASSSDVIVNLLPHTPETNGICDSTFFAAMPMHSIFINAGRGNIIAQESDLVKALESKQIFAAVIDVFKEEPLPAKHPFWHTERLIMTNHTAASSQHELVFQVFSSNLGNITKGQPLSSLINMDLGY
ncbi:MAG: phosphoglycerate dehydrogenase-like enzyme [Glaciecola sp.]|jgi:phosphoglycerate dehydrogenase-like enzyme